MRIGHLQLIAAEVERHPLPAIRGLHLDHPIRIVNTKAVDVLPGPVAVLLRNPSDLLGEAVLASLVQDHALVVKDALLAGPTKRPIPGIPAGDIVFAGYSCRGIGPPHPQSKKQPEHGLRRMVTDILCLNVPSRMITFPLGALRCSWQDRS